MHSQVCQLVKPARGCLNEMFVQALLQRGALPRDLGSLVSEYFKRAVKPLLSRRHEITARDKANDFVQNKLRFEVRRSRNLLMIPDESGLLNANEVFVQCSAMDATDTWSAESECVVRGDVVVCRSPAYHGSHVLLMQAVGEKDSEHGRKVISALGHLYDGTSFSTLSRTFWFT